MACRCDRQIARFVLAAAAGLLATSAMSQQERHAPIARYTMDLGTASGIGALAGSGGAQAAFAMIQGGANAGFAQAGINRAARFHAGRPWFWRFLLESSERGYPHALKQRER